MLGSLWYDLTIALGLASILVYFYVQKKFQFFKNRGIPHDEPTFLVGNSWNGLTFKENISQTTTKLYNKYPGSKVVGMYQGMRPVYIPRDPELITKIMIKDFSHFHDRGITVDEETNPLDGNLFNLDGTKWKTLRNKLTPTFTSGKLKGMYSIMDNCVDALVNYLDTVTDQEVEIKDILCRLTTDVIGSCAFGLESVAIKNPNCEFRQMGRKIFKRTAFQKLKFTARFIFPSVFKLFKVKTSSPEVESFFFNVTKQAFDYRLKNNIKRNDFVQLLLELREKGEVKTEPVELKDDEEEDAYLYTTEKIENISDNGKLIINDNILTAQAFVFFIAGFETSATSLSFIVYLLSKYQDAQEKLRQEVREVKQKYGSFSYDALKAMHYLEACMKEGMRMYPPVGALFRKCNKTLVEEDGTTLEAGYTLLIPILGLQNDPQYFPQPDVFMPERFINSDPVPGTYLPFGDGPRVCIAQRFATVELKLALAKLVDKFRIESCPKMADYEPIKLDPKAFITAPIGGIYVKLRALKTLSSL